MAVARRWPRRRAQHRASPRSRLERRFLARPEQALGPAPVRVAAVVAPVRAHFDSTQRQIPLQGRGLRVSWSSRLLRKRWRAWGCNGSPKLPLETPSRYRSRLPAGPPAAPPRRRERASGTPKSAAGKRDRRRSPTRTAFASPSPRRSTWPQATGRGRRPVPSS